MKSGMKYLIESFYRSIREGTPPPIPDWVAELIERHRRYETKGATYVLRRVDLPPGSDPSERLPTPVVGGLPSLAPRREGNVVRRAGTDLMGECSATGGVALLQQQGHFALH